MSKGKKIAIALAVLVGVALISGLTTMAVTNYGTQDDPLVTLSYLNDTVTPNILNQLNSALADRAAALQAQIDALNGQASGGSGSAPSGFVVLTLSSGQTVTCGVGTEIMPRLGSVVSYGNNSPRLVDETDASTVPSSGTTLTSNHLYMVTIKNNGVRATRNNTKILIRGEYTVS